MTTPEYAELGQLASVSFRAANGRQETVTVCRWHRERLAGSLAFLGLPAGVVAPLPEDARHPETGRRVTCRNCKGAPRTMTAEQRAERRAEHQRTRRRAAR